MKKQKKSDKYKKIKFEEGLARLEDIISILEQGKLGLEESIIQFREGSDLYLWLQDKLNDAEGEVKTIIEPIMENKSD